MVRAVVTIAVAAGTLACAQPQARVSSTGTASPGKQVYLADNCTGCHGSGRQGGTTGPPLWNLSGRWTEEALLRYLRDPYAYRQHDARLQQLYERFHVTMPAALTTSEMRLRELARYLLED
ncbi:MAG: c-type cytochrome [Acidobacteriota bacterium]